MPQSPGSVDEGFFNDLSRQPHRGSRDTDSPVDSASNGYDNEPPKAKRIACVICRKRKLKCDGNRPKCATCSRLGHDCAYDEVRRKSGPKRGYVKDLEARLAQVETQLSKSQDGKKSKIAVAKPAKDVSTVNGDGVSNSKPGTASDMPRRAPDTLEPVAEGMHNRITGIEDPMMISNLNGTNDALSDSQMIPNIDFESDNSFVSWEMIGLGLEEPMPTQDAIDELTDIYFDKIHPSFPMIHKSRYRASMNFAPDKRPPICLRYIMWCHAAAITDKYMHHQDIFYKRARKYIEMDEMKGHGEAFVSLAHAQTWCLVAGYEFKMMFFPRAWMSVGRAGRMVLMMGLNRVDGVGLDVKQCLPPPRDWTEREERRRTFWMSYAIDRYASIGTGWPMVIDERDIMTYLPATEEAYESSTAQKTPTLHECLTPQQITSLSSFAGVVFVTHFFGLNLTHLHRPEPNQREDDLNGDFWKRHHAMDNSLTQTSILLPSHLRVPAAAKNPNVVFLNFAIHTSTICLHQAAIFKAEKHRLPNSIIEKSRDRCLAAASAIEDVMRQTCHFDIAGMNPFMAFCLYVAARVFVQYLKKSPGDSQVRNALQFLLTAMEAMKLKNPLSESFLVQLHLDIKGNGLDIFFHNPDYSTLYMDEWSTPEPNKGLGFNSNIRCSPMINISETASSEGKSPEDTRIPKWHPSMEKHIEKSVEKPTFRTESPRQTQYAYRNIDLAAREAPKSTEPRPFFSDRDVQPLNYNNIFPTDGWTSGHISSNVSGLDLPTGIPMNGFDTEMSDPQQISSTGLTPQSNYSSNTSYSPPTVPSEDTQSTETESIPAGKMNGSMGFQQSPNELFTPQPSGGTHSGNGRSPVMNNKGQSFATNGQSMVSNAQMPNMSAPFSPDNPFKNFQNFDGLPAMTPNTEWNEMFGTMPQGMNWAMTPTADGS